MSARAPEVSRPVADAIAAAQRFLEPAFKDRDSFASITEKIAASQSSKFSPDHEGWEKVIEEAGVLLLSIHKAILADQNQSPGRQVYDSTLLNTVYNLLDLLILDGVYPALPVGVGSPLERRTKCLLFRKPDPTYTSPKDLGIIASILNNTLNVIAADVDRGIEPMQRGRVLNDLIAGNAWLAHTQNIPFAATTLGQHTEKYDSIKLSVL